MAALKILFMNISDPDKTEERVIVSKMFDNKQKARRSLLCISELSSTHSDNSIFIFVKKSIGC